MKKNISIAIIAIVVFGLMLLSGLPSAKAVADNCLPVFTSGIIIDPKNPDKQPTAVAPGESTEVKFTVDRLRGCTGYDISISSDNPGISFVNVVKTPNALQPTSLQATMKVDPNIDLGKNAVVTGTVSHSGWSNDITAELGVMTNTKPAVEPIYPDLVPSYSTFQVDVSSAKSGTGIDGKGVDEGGDRVWRAKVTVVAEDGKTVLSVKEKTAGVGETLPLISGKTGAIGFARIFVEIEDTFGAVYVYDGLVNIGTAGASSKDVPPIVINGVFTCVVNTDCELDASGTESPNYNVTGFRFDEITGGIRRPLLNKLGGICSTPVCITRFNRTGTKIIEVRAKIEGKEKFGTKQFLVDVVGQPIPEAQMASSSVVAPRATENKTEPPVKTVKKASEPIASPQPGTTGIKPDCVGKRCGGEKSIPGPEGILVIFAIVFLARIMKK